MRIRSKKRYPPVSARTSAHEPVPEGQAAKALEARVARLRKALSAIANHELVSFGPEVEVIDLSSHNLGATIESMRRIARQALEEE